MGLSPYLWLGITVAMLTLAVLGWFQAPARKAVPYLIGIVIGLSTLLTVLVVSSGIFEGESRVAPDAIARTIDAIDASRGPAAQRPPPAPVR